MMDEVIAPTNNSFLNITKHGYIDTDDISIRRDVANPDWFKRFGIIEQLVVETGSICFNYYTPENTDYLLHLKTLDTQKGLYIESEQTPLISLKSNVNGYITNIYQQPNSVLRIDKENENLLHIDDTKSQFSNTIIAPEINAQTIKIDDHNLYDIFVTLTDSVDSLTNLENELKDYTNQSVLNLRNEFINTFYTKQEITSSINDLRNYLETKITDKFNDLLGATYTRQTIDQKIVDSQVYVINNVLSATYTKNETSQLLDSLRNELKLYSDQKDQQLKDDFDTRYIRTVGGQLTGNLFLINNSVLTFGEILENGTTYRLERINSGYESNIFQIYMQNATNNPQSSTQFRVMTPFGPVFSVNYQGDSYIKGNARIGGSLLVDGNFSIQGSSYTIESTTISMTDNIITLNKGETQDGVGETFSGIEIDRGLLPISQWVFDETDDSFKHLINGNLSPISVPLIPSDSHHAVSKAYVDGKQYTHDHISDWDIAFVNSLSNSVNPTNVENGISVWVDNNKLNFDVKDFRLTFAGHVVGYQDIVNLGDTTINLQVVDDSHKHDSRYYTKTESDNRFVNSTGDTLSGTFDLSNATLKWYNDSDSAYISLKDYGTDQKWLTINFRDNTNQDRIRYTFTDTNGTSFNVMDILSNGVHFYRSNIYLYDDENDNPSISFSYGDNTGYWRKIRWNTIDKYFELQAEDGSYHKILTTLDQGSGNGLDADTLDGLDSSKFLRSDIDDYFSGTLSWSANSGIPFKFDSNYNYMKQISIDDGDGNYNITSNWNGNGTHAITDGAARITLNTEGQDGEVKLRVSPNQSAGSPTKESYLTLRPELLLLETKPQTSGQDTNFYFTILADNADVLTIADHHGYALRIDTDTISSRSSSSQSSLYDSSNTLHLNPDGGDVQIGSFTTPTNTILSVQSTDSKEAIISVHGSSQGTGRIYLGQSATYGGGIIYNGDDNPDVVGNNQYITFYRRVNNIDYSVFGYSNTNSRVYFYNDIAIKDDNTLIQEGLNNSIRLKTNNGYIDVGPQDANNANFDTDKTQFYFTKPIVVSGNISSNYVTVQPGSTNGIRFPDNAFGGTGDTASIYLTNEPTTSENQQLVIEVANDSDDIVNIKTPSNTGLKHNGYTVWTSGNDGTNSGLDADKLDGQDGSFYRNASNLNAGTVPADRLTGTYNIDISGNAESATKLKTPITIELTGDVTGSVTNADGSSNISIQTTLVGSTVEKYTIQTSIPSFSSFSLNVSSITTDTTKDFSTSIINCHVYDNDSTSSTYQNWIVDQDIISIYYSNDNKTCVFKNLTDVTVQIRINLIIL